MEYVGEVLDPRQFRKRARKYASDDVQHFYFMALSSEYFIDASSKGNISRFINHSCDPNAETQKVSYLHENHKMLLQLNVVKWKIFEPFFRYLKEFSFIKAYKATFGF